MLTRIAGGRVIDPAHDRDALGDIWISDGHIVDPPSGAKADLAFDAKGHIVMAGAIDVHSHIAGTNVTAGRLMMPELDRLGFPAPSGLPSAHDTGCRYAIMGFTTVVEPATSPHDALQAHLELSDIPIIDKATLCVLGNDDYLLSLLHHNESEAAISDYVAWSVQAARAIGVKVINAGGVAAFKQNVREFSLDDTVPHYGATSRRIVKALQRAVQQLGLPHPLHVHCNNLGLAGNVETALATIKASEDEPMHFAHLQFYGYGAEGDRGFSSAASRLAEAVNAAKNVTVDVGQVMFGQTVTISLDVLRQFGARHQARPKKWLIHDSDANGVGIVPYEYRAKDFYNAIQWAVGLELFLLIDDPWRVFLTTDHPNGAHFTTYPALLALLMRRNRREEWIKSLPEAAIAVTTLPSITREYSLRDVAVMTRAAPAKLLGLRDRGHLAAGALADIAVYKPNDDPEKMFSAAALVFKDGELVVRDGEIVKLRQGRTLNVTPPFDHAIKRRMDAYYETRYGLSSDVIVVRDAAFASPEAFERVPCLR